MTEFTQKSTQVEQKQKPTGLWAAGIFSAVSLACFGFLSYNVVAVLNGQFDVSTKVLMPMTVTLFIVSLTSFVLIRRDRGTLGAALLFSLIALTSIAATLLIEGGGLVSGVCVTLLSLIMIAWVLPKPLRRRAIISSAIVIALVIFIEIWNPAFRVAAALAPNFTAAVAVFTGSILFLLFITQLLISGRLRNRIIALMLMVLLPMLILYSYINVTAQQQDLEQALLDRAKAAAITGATAIEASLEDAIATGQLTTEAVFDQNYIRFFTFDPAKYPELTDDSRIYDKYHTAYDAYTDKHWQKLVDSYLNDQEKDIVFATAADINGYIPTHNSVFSTGDGDPATDRTKRLFNDAVGLAAARNTKPFLQQVYLRSGTGETLWDVSAPIDVNGQHWGTFRVDVQLAQNQLRVQAATLRAVILSSILLAIVVVFAWLLGRYITGPIERLTTASQEAAGGNLETRIDIPNRDEITILANAFNRMTTRLREFISTLEERVAERTQSLELAAEVGRSVSQVRALDVMLKEAAELIRTQFDLYYVQVYLTDPSQTNLILQSGTGTVGAELVRRGHRLPLNTASINGRAAIEKKSVVISDTAASATFRPNPLLPHTRSEMAVPLLIGDKVVGVLDMQSEHSGSLNQDVLPAFEALAGQLAIAIQNATLLAETQQARAEVEAQARRQSRANWVDYLDAIHQPEELGFVFEQNKIAPLTGEEQATDNALVAPIAVTGEALGNLMVEMEDHSPISRTAELVETVARQVSQQIESLRLLESAERYRAEAEAASRRLTREGWKDYVQANAGESLSYIYDLQEVRPFNPAGDQQTDKLAFSLPLKVRDETVGQLSVLGLKSDDKESLELVTAVAERLGAHIEGLRLSKQTEQALATTQQFAQREQALRQITSAVRGSTDPATILRTAARELGTLLGRKTIVRLATARETPAGQTALVGDSAAPSGNESAPPAGASNAVGGDE
jgi:GAF domain-containing protein/HAMP domain-containing protein